MPIKSIDEYLYELKPVVNTTLWQTATRKIDSVLRSAESKLNAYQELRDNRLAAQKKLVELQDSIKEQEKLAERFWEKGDFQKYESTMEGVDSMNLQAKGLQAQISDNEEAEKKILGGKTEEKLGKQALFQNNILKVISGATSGISALTGVMKTAVKVGTKLAEMGAERSNQFVSNDSMFVDTGIRDLMGKYGLSSVQAQGLNQSMDLMGISTSDFGRLSEGQQNLLNELTQQYQDSINSINPEKLDQFNESMQEFQAVQASLQMRMQTLITKLLAESPGFQKILDNLEHFFSSVMSFLESPVVQWFFNVFTEAVGALLQLLSWIMDLVTIVFGGSTGNTTNNTTNNTSNTNTFYISGQNADATQQQIENALQAAGVNNG